MRQCTVYNAIWAEIGRFISQNQEQDGVNWYGYVGNRPTVAVDPEGLLGKLLCAVLEKRRLDATYKGSGVFAGRDHFQHCVYACKIRKKCGWRAAWDVSIGKEVIDAVTPGDCSWGDLKADQAGIRAGGAGRNCERACNRKYPKRKRCPRPRARNERNRMGARP